MSKVEECLICKKPLIYLNEAKKMECAICKNEFLSNACCEDGHFVCDSCHNDGAKLIKSICLNSTSKSPLEIATELMKNDFIYMHGPEHHVLVGSALLTAYKNAGGDIDLDRALAEMYERGSKVPGGICGFWGNCGAAVSFGIFVSIVTEATPLTVDSWGMSNLATARALNTIGNIGGPRCCKRNTYLSINEAIDFVEEKLGITMDKVEVKCKFKSRNAQCIGKRCPFN